MSLVNGVGVSSQTLDIQIAANEARPRNQSISPKDPGAASTKISDATTISSASTLVSQALAGSDVQTEKVEALRQAITAGTYHVPSTEIADKILNTMTAESGS
ncbi:MAG: flagellar biosynthesis anti-sigma factor FlgM [Edaphobacter sp.]|uniref:flagellar biosynthesis anti-sigma factor FlgM n=1 Tax=Edaphobacter sp. TaxID=1934404 RepID=UPI002387B1B2|nr:flagellar biosynthesis anti-sigma factor FlgM [Edaphobacter sp.]MDE1175129.1 flagellar biosynthesis anti-sigma factor FlgM [Edaphobacter sp.]